MERFSVFWCYTLLSLILCNSIWLSNRKHENHKSSSPSCFFRRRGGPIQDERTFRMILSLPFFDGGWWVFGEFFIFCPCGGLLIPPAPCIWKTLTHLCRTTLVLQAEKCWFLSDRWCHPLHVRDLLQLQQGPYVFYINDGYFEKRVYWIRQSVSGFVGKKS